jgi:hypothetical protein
MKPTHAPLPVLVLVLCVGLASAQDRPLSPEQRDYRQGTHVTRRLLHELQFTPLYGPEDFDQYPADTLLVVLGDLGVLEGLDHEAEGRTGRLDRFLSNGGAILIASDLPANGRQNQILFRLGLVYTFSVTTRIKTDNPADRYKDFDDCPYVVPTSKAPADQLFGSGEQQLKHVATNIPSALWRNLDGPKHLPVLAGYPKDCQVIIPGRGEPGPGLSPPLFAVGGEVGFGKVLILADHSVLINMMMIPHDNDNVRFALNTLTWLREGRTGPRTKALFYEDGNINSFFEVPLKEPKLPEIKPEDIPFLIRQGDAILAGLEDDNKFDSGLQQFAPKGSRISELWALLAALGSLALLVYGSWRLLTSGRTSIENGLPTLGRAVDQHTPEVSTLTQRQRELLRSGNFWEPAHVLAQEAFARAAVVVPAGTRLPRIVDQAGFWERWQRRRWVRNLVLLAYGPPRPVSAADWARLPAELSRLVTLLQSGEIALLG